MESESSADLWFVPTAEVNRPSLVEKCLRLLTPAEAEQHRKFVFEKHRHEYLVTRALARGVLAQYVGKTPGELEFVRNEYGRPELTPPGIRFNLSNSTKLVVCLVARGREVGVDTEPLDRAERILDVETQFFTPAERRGLAALPWELRLRRAVALWTLKESYMKARGMGMSIPAKDFELQFEESAIRLILHPPLVDPTPWEFETRELEGHLVATCIERGGSVRVLRANLDELLARD
jgi:4'-phosphopantetheinyl transferase